jgi:hypothetical protein
MSNALKLANLITWFLILSLIHWLAPNGFIYWCIAIVVGSLLINGMIGSARRKRLIDETVSEEPMEANEREF